MGPPHHEVGEDSNPQNRAQEGHHKEFLGFLFEKVIDVKAKHSVRAFKIPHLRHASGSLPGCGHLEL